MKRHGVEGGVSIVWHAAKGHRSDSNPGRHSLNHWATGATNQLCPPIKTCFDSFHSQLVFLPVTAPPTLWLLRFSLVLFWGKEPKKVRKGHYVTESCFWAGLWWQLCWSRRGTVRYMTSGAEGSRLTPDFSPKKIVRADNSMIKQVWWNWWGCCSRCNRSSYTNLKKGTTCW